VQLARKWYAARLLSREGYRSVVGREKSPKIGNDGDGVLVLPKNTWAEDFEGLTKEEAIALAKKRGQKWRIVEEDGKSFALTADYLSTRMNFTIEKGKVVKAENY